ncbi:MAG: dihydropteroate synthase [Acidimicrobiia bacterium]
MFTSRDGSPLRTPVVVGVLNVTPDSFSDGGRFLAVDAAVAHGVDMARAGAAVIDVGGESTRPGAEPVAAPDELRRVVPVIERLARTSDAVISIDTTKASVARAAITAGATVVNDVSAGRFDDDMIPAVAETGVSYVVMHMRGEPRTMQQDPHYDDVVREVAEFLVERLDAARAAGVAGDRLVADPGIGFGKTLDHNLELLARLPELVECVGVPVMIGTSRKSFIGSLLDVPVPPAARDAGSIATAVWAIERGATAVRVHDVLATVQAVVVLDAIRRAVPEGLVA